MVGSREWRRKDKVISWEVEDSRGGTRVHGGRAGGRIRCPIFLPPSGRQIRSVSVFLYFFRRVSENK
jgi:hypothetical protein